MRRTEDHPNALKSATLPGVLEMLQANNSYLEKIHRCLEVTFVLSMGKRFVTSIHKPSYYSVSANLSFVRKH